MTGTSGGQSSKKAILSIAGWKPTISSVKTYQQSILPIDARLFKDVQVPRDARGVMRIVSEGHYPMIVQQQVLYRQNLQAYQERIRKNHSSNLIAGVNIAIRQSKRPQEESEPEEQIEAEESDGPFSTQNRRIKEKPERKLDMDSTKRDNYGDLGVNVRLVKMRIIKNMTKNGKYIRFSATVASGNGRGAVGVAHSKALTASDAVAKATRLASRSMQQYSIFDGRTIYHDDRIKFKATLLYVRPAAPGSGRRCHPAIAEICRCMGISDISAKVHGSRNPINVANAFLIAMRRQKTPEAVAQETGLHILDVLSIYHTGCEDLTRAYRAERYSTYKIKDSLRNLSIS